MRRSWLIIIIVLLLPLHILMATGEDFSTITRFSDLRSVAMGSTGVALTDLQGAFYRNPAALYKWEFPVFHLGARFGENMGVATVAGDPIPWVQHPSTTLEMLFSNRYIALAIGLASVLEERTLSGSELEFIAYNDSRIQLTLAYGWPSISVGFYARGGNRFERDVTIREGHAIRDYITRTHLERYNRTSADGQIFTTGLGLLLSYQWVSIGLVTNSLFNFDYTTNELVLDIVDLFNSSTVGLAFSSPIYNENNELNRVVINSAIDLTDLGDTNNRSVRLGLEGKVQFLSNFWVALRAGYREKRPLDVSLFNLHGTGAITFGIGGQIRKVVLDISASIPLKTEDPAIHIGLRWTL
ncbi:MAG: hypothetical protein WCS59_02590 [Sphaerochaetaceae bacterium]